MLLSTDWFLPHWSTLRMTTENNACIQKGCREIVKQVMKEASDYYLVDFSDGRLETTRENIRALARKCGMKGPAEATLVELIGNKPEREQFHKGAWLFQMLSGQLTADDRLDAMTRLVITRAKDERRLTDELNFEQLCLRANSAWDSYIRGLTPELPTMLPDFLSALLASAQLTHVLAQLTTIHKAQLLSKFQFVAKAVTGVEVDGTWSAV